jgi:hypothetical protein
VPRQRGGGAAAHSRKLGEIQNGPRRCVGPQGNVRRTAKINFGALDIEQLGVELRKLRRTLFRGKCDAIFRPRINFACYQTSRP